MAKAPADLRSLARSHTETAVRVLAGIMQQDTAPAAARVGAAEVLLSRGWGKPTQPHSGDDDSPPIRFERIVRAIIEGGKEAEDEHVAYSNGKGLPPAS